MTTIAVARSDAEIARRYPVMAELTRPLGGAAAFLERARAEGCTGVGLDSGLQRGAAQRFYMAKGMEIGAFHFRLPLQGPGDGQGE